MCQNQNDEFLLDFPWLSMRTCKNKSSRRKINSPFRNAGSRKGRGEKKITTCFWSLWVRIKETQVFDFHLKISESSTYMKNSHEHGEKNPALLCQGRRGRQPHHSIPGLHCPHTHERELQDSCILIWRNMNLGERTKHAPPKTFMHQAR